MPDRDLLELPLGIVDLSEGRIDSGTIDRVAVEGGGELVPGFLDLFQQRPSLFRVAALDRGELGLLIRSDLELGVEPLVERIARGIVRIGVDMAFVMLRRLPGHHVSRQRRKNNGGGGPKKGLLRWIQRERRGFVAPLKRVNCGGAGRTDSLVTLEPMRKARTIAAAQEIAPVTRTSLT